MENGNKRITKVRQDLNRTEIEEDRNKAYRMKKMQQE